MAVEDKELNEAIKNIRKYHKQDTAKDFTDDDAKSIGEFKDVDEFKTKIRSQIEDQKKMMASEKKKIALVEEIIKETKVSVPEILVQAEIGKMLARFKADVDRAGMKFEDYLKQIKKDEEQLVKEWRPDALKQAKLQLILNKIASEEKIVPDKERVEAELKNILEHQKDADKEMARIYIYTILMNEKVFEWLESVGKTQATQEKKASN